MVPFVPITTAAFQMPLPVEHKGNNHPTGPTSGLLDGSDNRVMNATMRGGTIWLAHTTAVDATGNGGAAAPDRECRALVPNRLARVDSGDPPVRNDLRPVAVRCGATRTARSTSTLRATPCSAFR